MTYLRLVLAGATVDVGLFQGLLWPTMIPLLKNTTDATICKLQAGLSIVADTAAAFQEAFATENKGNLDSLVDKYDLMSYKIVIVLAGYFGGCYGGYK